MFKQNHSCVQLRIGNPITYQYYSKLTLPIKQKTELFRQHLCRLGKTSDNKQIYLFNGQGNSPILREVGRLREIAFRAVGEGSDQRRDTDIYDKHYFQLILWDNEDLEIAGAYRFCPTNRMKLEAADSLYFSTLFEFQPGMATVLEKGLEPGRRFVQPRYWERRSLDYLWYGIGAFLKQNPEYRYLFGPVSLSNSFPKYAMDMLVHFYSVHFPPEQPIAISK